MPSLDRVRFLVVDDNAYMINLVETILRGFGAKLIFSARDATEAFHKLKNDSIDIVIVDFMMPLLDGIEFIKLVRQSSDSGNRYVPIIMLTAYTEKSRVESARDAGANEVCCKPVTANDLFRKIVSVVDQPRPFIRSASFFGPDRRRKTDRNYSGEERRKAAPEATPPTLPSPSATQGETDHAGDAA